MIRIIKDKRGRRRKVLMSFGEYCKMQDEAATLSIANMILSERLKSVRSLGIKSIQRN